MEWLKNNGDRFALLVIALVAILVSGMMIAKSLSFSDDFVYDHVTGDARKREVPPTAAESVSESQAAIGEDVIWKLPAISGKPEVPYFKSVVLIQKGNQIFDLDDPNGPKLRPPMTNRFLVDNQLDYTRSDVGDLDEDKDGFSNLEEFRGMNGVSTDPTDPKDHPPLTNKLFVKERIEIPYIIVFSSNSGDLYQVGEKREGERMNRLFVKKDATFFDRFTVLGFRTETVFDDRINVEREMGILTVRDSASGENIDLIQGREYNLPSFIGVFLHTWKVDMEIQVKKGDVFKIDGDPRTFKLVDILESEAVIVPSDAEGNEIEGAQKIRISSLSTRGMAPAATDPGRTPGTPGGTFPATPDGRPMRLPDGTTPAPTPGGTTPPAPVPGETAPAPGGTTPPAPIPGGTTIPAPVPGGSAPSPVPGGTAPSPVPGGTVPAPIPGGAPPAPGGEAAPAPPAAISPGAGT